jgi:hypothetical protein
MIHDSKVYGPGSRATQLISSTFCEHLIEEQHIAIYANLGIGNPARNEKVANYYLHHVLYQIGSPAILSAPKSLTDLAP